MTAAVRLISWPAFSVLAVMLLVDGALVQLHRLHLQGALDARFSLEVERSVSEYYQHAKELLAAVLTMALFVRRGGRLYLVWAALFGYLFVDDAFQVHERAGASLAGAWGVPSVAGVAARDVAELLVSATAGLLFLAGLVLAWRRGETGPRTLSFQLLVTLAALALFGVAVDALHTIVETNPWDYRLGMLEDGGELAAMSAMLWVVFVHGAGIAAKSR